MFDPSLPLRAGVRQLPEMTTTVYRASDGYPLQHRCWRPAGQPLARIIALHGIQSHGGWYQYSSQQLADAGYEVHFLDRRGSGLNSRDRGHAIHEERLIADVRQFLNHLRWSCRHEPQVPVILMGVSWGGKLAAACAATFPDQIDGLALLYPGIYSRLRPSFWQRFRLEWASAIGWERVPVPIPLNEPELFTDSPAWREYIRRDELALHRVTVNFLRSNVRLSQLLEARGPEIRGPVLMMLAGRDQIINNASNRAFLGRLTRAQTRLAEYDRACHTLEFEDDPNPFIQDLILWLDGVTGGNSSEQPVPAPVSFPPRKAS